MNTTYRFRQLPSLLFLVVGRACMAVVVRTYNTLEVVLSGIQTWDLSDSIPNLNFGYRCLRPLGHRGWLDLSLI